LASGTRLLTGWGRTAPSAAEVVEVLDLGEVRQALAGAGPRGVLARGLGRSYGDAAQNAGGRVLRLPDHGGLRLDPATGLVTARAGLSLDRVLRHLLPAGRFVPVTPGTRLVTVGGAVAADVHGKNHHVAGSFGAHVTSLRLLTPDGTEHDLSPRHDAEAFWATVGGMGLTGVITEVSFRAPPVETSRMLVDTTRAADLDDCMAQMAEADHRYRYSVAWIDLVARGRSLGRSVLTCGDHAPLAALPPTMRGEPLAFDPSPLAAAPAFVPGGLLNRLSVRAFNEVWFRRAPRARTGEVQSIGAFFHPLDGVDDWNRIYGPSGFLQYQFVVPFGPEGERALRTAVERLSASGVASFLAVLKRFGPAGEGMLSFPMAGWTLALDLPAAGGGLADLLDRLDRLVLDAGGRLYFAKDSRMPAAVVPAMYPRLAEWQAVRRRLDPAGRLQSDLGRRLGLCGPRPQEDA
jgi:decaprenylphospho-beta-D-ribofuranose 2-oxidase